MSPFIRPRPTSLWTAHPNRRRARRAGRGHGTSAGSRSVRGPLTLEQLEGRQVLAAFVASATYVVNTLADAGPGSLRQAIIDANAHKGPDAIDFSVAGTIALKSALPAITDSLDLDGSSAPGYAGKPVVTLDFQNNAGLVVSAGANRSVIQSLSLVDSSGAGLSLAASEVTVAGSYIGLRADGITIESNRGDGVAIVAGAHDNVIGNGDGTSSFQLSNVISGNRGNGVSIAGAGAVNNRVAMNYIGTDVSGTRRRGNGGNGVLITSTNPAFDSNDQGTWNIIRTSLVGGNVGNGIEIAGNASGVQITDSGIGTNWKILRPVPNGGSGIVVGGTAHDIAIGGFQPSIEQFDTTSSVHIGGNKGYGIEMRDLAHDVTVFNTVVGAGVGLIGPTLRKAVPLPNGKGGIAIRAGVADVAIGNGLDVPNGYSVAVSSNNGAGITIDGASGVSVEGTRIEHNAQGGIRVSGGTGVRIGTETAPNAITGNSRWGVLASGTLTNSAVSGNLISRNAGNGMILKAAQGLLVGGTENGSGNTITRNAVFGLLATGHCSGSTVEGNTVKRNAAGNMNVGNSSGLVVVEYSLILGANESVTGVRGAKGKKVVLVGSYKLENSSTLMGQWWVGDLTTGVGKAVRVNPTFSGQTVTTSLSYGPNTSAFNPAIGKNDIRVVGTYKYSESAVDGQHGVLYQGPANGVGGTWTPINVPADLAGGTVTNTIPHSTMGNLVVGNYSVEGQQVDAASAFIYDISSGEYQVFDSSWGGLNDLTSAYGVWQNGGPTSSFYTIVGGSMHEGANTAYMVDYDASTKTFSHKTFFPLETAFAGDTHFEGINAAPGGYTLSATILSGGTADAAYAYVPVNRDGGFNAAQWVPLHYPGSSFCSGDTVYQNVEMGICIVTDPVSQQSVERTYKATVTVTGGPTGGANISIPAARKGFVGPAGGARRFAQYGPTQLTTPDQLNQPIGQAKADEIARALGLDRSLCFTPEQRALFMSGNGANGSGDPQQAALVDESVNLLTNSTVNPLTRLVNGTPTRIVLGSYGLAVSKDGVWLDSLANKAEPTRRVNEVIAPGGYMDTWAQANGATESLQMLRRSVYTLQLPYGIAAQQVNVPAQLAVYRNGFDSAVVGLSMTPPLWEVNFCLIYTLDPALAAKMPAQWHPIPAEVATALLESETGRVRFSDYDWYFPTGCVVVTP
ncbi:MAG: right-handed parallel beta-helix repeat-containing protein [Planctomycetes bacterium]|nr:right-handed parallel beta-helix repeat-containing protein [Planctomycetota bacterium]